MRAPIRDSLSFVGAYHQAKTMDSAPLFRCLGLLSATCLLWAVGCHPRTDPQDRAAWEALRELGAEMDISPAGRVASVELSRTKVTDDDLRYLDHLDWVWTVSLYDTGITDAGLEHLAGLKNLKFLNLENTAVTAAGLKSARDLRRLRVIWLSGTKVTERDLPELQRTIPNVRFVLEPTTERLGPS